MCVCVCSYEELKKVTVLGLQKSSFELRNTDWFENYVIVHEMESFQLYFSDILGVCHKNKKRP